MENESPIACDLSALAPDARDEHKQVSETVLGAITEVRERPDGYAFRLPTETEMIRAAATFVARERQCCPFFDFTIDVERERGPVWLSLSGRDGVKQYVEETVLPTLQAVQD